MNIVDTNKIIVESFEKIGFLLQYVYQETEDCDEISLSVELTQKEAKSITIQKLEVMKDYIVSESNNDKDTINEFFEVSLLLKNTESDLFLVWE